MNIDLKITGGGDTREVAAALRQIAIEIESGIHNNTIESDGEVTIEDGFLLAELSESF